MSTLQKFVVAMLLLLTGLIAGLQTLMLMGILPAIKRMPLATYAGMWQSLDHFMAVRMPILVNVTFLFFLIALVLFMRNRNKGMVWTLVGCFALLITDTVFTVTQQLPINHAVQSLDLSQVKDFSQVQYLRDTTIDHFLLRSWLSIGAFVWLVFVTVFSFAGKQIQRSREMHS